MTKEQKERLLEETQQTAARLNELNEFMASDIFPSLDRIDKDLIYEESRTKNRLVQILGQRLEREGKVFEHACCCNSGADAGCINITRDKSPEEYIEDILDDLGFKEFKHPQYPKGLQFFTHPIHPESKQRTVNMDNLVTRYREDKELLIAFLYNFSKNL